MSYDDAVYAALTQSGLKGTKYAWPIGGAPPLPWFTYRRTKGGEVFADDGNFALMRHYDIELYQRELDDEVRDHFEEYVATIGPFSSFETWIPSENCWQTSYRVTYHPNN